LVNGISEKDIDIFEGIVPSTLKYDIGQNLGGKREIFSYSRRDRSRIVKRRLNGKL
jgi:hypothetical protein